VEYLPSNSIPLPSGERGQLSARDVGKLMRDHIWEIAGITTAVVALGLAYLFIATPIYMSDVLLRVDPPEPNQFGLALQSQEAMPPPAPSTSTEMAVMQSRSVIGPIIEKYRFDVSVIPHTLPVLGSVAEKFATPGHPSAPWLGLRSFAWGGEQVRVASLEVPRSLEEEKLKLVVLGNGEYELRGPSDEHLLAGKVGELAKADGISMMISQLVARPGTQFEVIRWNELDAVTRFMKLMEVKDKAKDTGLIEVTFTDKYPEKAAEVTNAITQQYIATAIENRQQNDSATLAFITRELPRLRDELKRSEEALSDYEASSKSVQPTSEAQAFLQGGIDFDKQIAALQIQRTQLMEKYTPDSRWVVNVNTQLAQLSAAKAAFDQRFGGMPVAQRKNVDLTRDAKVAETIYLGMVQKAEQLSVRRASTSGGVHIVDEAIPALHPERPKPVIVLAGSVFLGLFLGAFSVFMRRHVMTGVTDPLYVEHRLSVPLYGEVLFSKQQMKLDVEMAGLSRRGLSGKGRDAGGLQRSSMLNDDRSQNSVRLAGMDVGDSRLLATRFAHDPSVEALRTVRTAISRDLAHAPNNIVMFTGPTPAAGKSFVAANLAALHAETGARVLLIDADMRRGHLASFFGQTNRNGLGEVLKGHIKPFDAIRNVGVDGLYFMACGSHTEYPAALLMKHGFKEMLQRFSEHFDLVVIDTPPFLAVTDASIIASEAGATILVLRSGMQSEAEIADTVKKLERSEARIAGAVFNAMPVRRSNPDYGYASYATPASPLDVA
jgi:tyrosine-protein kinase Etk/Wzc